MLARSTDIRRNRRISNRFESKSPNPGIDGSGFLVGRLLNTFGGARGVPKTGELAQPCTPRTPKPPSRKEVGIARQTARHVRRPAQCVQH